MRLKITLFLCSAFLIGGLIIFVYERNRYNVVSHAELIKIRDKLKVLTPQERQDLAFFIDQAIRFDQYPYTLVGYKPMSISNVIVEDTEDLQSFLRESFKTPRCQTLKRGYLTWKKYQSLFPRKVNLIIDYSFLGKGRREIALISPQVCKAAIEENLGEFQKILGKPCSSEEVFWILTHPDHDGFPAIVDNTRLIGILLGFGRNNAYLYEKYRGGVSRSNPDWNQGLALDPLKMSSNERPLPGRLLPPNFACDPNTEETKKLKAHYKKARKIVRWTYFLRNNLEVTLALLER